MATALALSMLTIYFAAAALSPSIPAASAAVKKYSVSSYGAKPDGKTDSTNAFLTAWNKACSSPSPSTVHVPAGRFYLKNVAFQGPCKTKSIMFRIDGTLVAPSDYSVIAKVGNWILFRHVNGVIVSGGTLDGQGASLWSCKAAGKSCPTGASNSQNVQINGLTSVNSQLFHIMTNGCQNVKVKGVEVTAAGNSPNTDGIHVQSSAGVTILNSRIGTGDDCISIGPGTTNLWIENIDSGIKVSDVTYQDVHGSSRTEVAIKFACSKSNPCTGIRLDGVKLTYENQAADSSCQNADGTTSGVVQPSSCL
ncbi:unnamed protein product [Linum tenue]|uniref:Polygalacturonase n=1 Tax=Linum tenue TaxID=586396 RepID=A0AAV0KIY9_9ROSI|nr:unnamed protein product [Linum tenue]